LLWCSIKLVDRHNPRNRFGTALIMSAVNLLAAFLLVQLPFALFLSIGYLVLTVQIISRYYMIGVLKTILVLVIMPVVTYVGMPVLVGFAEDSELRGMLVLYGVPAAILVTWLVGRRRGAPAIEEYPLPERVATLPKAQAVRVPDRKDVASPVATAARGSLRELAPGAEPRPMPTVTPLAAVAPVTPLVPIASAPPPPHVTQPHAPMSNGPTFLN
jgi:hypothetical protein